MRVAADGIIAEGGNPAAKVAKPGRLDNTRTALVDDRLAEVIAVADTSDDDPELDSLKSRFHVETAARGGALLDLRPRDLDVQQCLVMLQEKYGTFRWQPVSPTLMSYLLHHVDQRGTGPDQPLLRYRNGQRASRTKFGIPPRSVGE